MLHKIAPSEANSVDSSNDESTLLRLTAANRLVSFALTYVRASAPVPLLRSARMCTVTSTLPP
jgi:hypothetical protein